MANEIELSEQPIKRYRGSWEAYSNNIFAQQQLDYNASQQNSSALNEDTQMVRITNTSTTPVRFRVRDAGSFTISTSNSDYLDANTSVDVQVSKGAGQIVSIINA